MQTLIQKQLESLQNLQKQLEDKTSLMRLVEDEKDLKIDNLKATVKKLEKELKLTVADLTKRKHIIRDLQTNLEVLQLEVTEKRQ